MSAVLAAQASANSVRCQLRRGGEGAAPFERQGARRALPGDGTPPVFGEDHATVCSRTPAASAGLRTNSAS